MNKNKYLIISDFFNTNLSQVSSMYADRLKVCLLLSFLETRGKEIKDEKGFLLKDEAFLSKSQEVNISLTQKATPIFYLRNENVTYYIEQNLIHYTSDFGKPFTITVINADASTEKNDCYFEDIEAYLLKHINGIRL